MNGNCRRLLLALACWYGCVGSVRAQAVPPEFADPNRSWTLEELEAIADDYNPILSRSRAQIESARGAAQQAGIFPNPRFDTNNPQVLNGRNTALNAGVQMEIPVMGKKRLDQAAASEVVRQTETTFFQNRFDMLSAIRQQFYTVLIDERRIQVLTMLLDIVRKAYEIGQKKHKVGEASRSDVLLLLIDYQRAQANLQNTQAILEGDRKQLAALVGIPGLAVRNVTGRLIGAYPVFDEELLRRYVILQHTQIRIAGSVIEQTKYQLRRAEVEPVPNPYLGPAYQYGLTPGQDQFWFNIQFSLPVWDRNQGNIRAARANVGVAQQNLRTIQNNYLNQASNSFSRYQGALAVVRRFEEEILPNTNETVRLASEGYEKGLTDFSTYLQVQRTIVQANIDYLDALQNLWRNATELAGLLQLEKFP